MYKSIHPKKIIIIIITNNNIGDLINKQQSKW